MALIPVEESEYYRLQKQYLLDVKAEEEAAKREKRAIRAIVFNYRIETAAEKAARLKPAPAPAPAPAPKPEPAQTVTGTGFLTPQQILDILASYEKANKAAAELDDIMNTGMLRLSTTEQEMLLAPGRAGVVEFTPLDLAIFIKGLGPLATGAGLVFTRLMSWATTYKSVITAAATGTAATQSSTTLLATMLKWAQKYQALLTVIFVITEIPQLVNMTIFSARTAGVTPTTAGARAANINFALQAAVKTVMQLEKMGDYAGALEVVNTMSDGLTTLSNIIINEKGGLQQEKVYELATGYRTTWSKYVVSKTNELNKRIAERPAQFAAQKAKTTEKAGAAADAEIMTDISIALVNNDTAGARAAQKTLKLTANIKKAELSITKKEKSLTAAKEKAALKAKDAAAKAATKERLALEKNAAVAQRASLAATKAAEKERIAREKNTTAAERARLAAEKEATRKQLADEKATAKAMRDAQTAELQAYLKSLKEEMAAVTAQIEAV